MEVLCDIFKRFCSYTKKGEEAYLITNDGNKSLFLIKKSDRYWKTEWHNSTKYFKTPEKSLDSVFRNK
jgi:hypothetical protein